MAWTVVSKGKADPQDGTVHSGRSVTGDGPVAVGDFGFALIGRGASGVNDFASDTLTDSLGNVWTKAATPCYSLGDSQGLSVWTTPVTHAGTPTVTSTYPGQRNYDSLAFAFVHSSLGAAALDVVASSGATPLATANGSADNCQVALASPSVDGCVILGGYANLSTTNAVAAGTGFTSDEAPTEANGGDSLVEHFVQGSKASLSVTATIAVTGARWGGVAVAVNPNAAAVAVPANTTAPAISGIARVGQTLLVEEGLWTGSPTGYGYQWQNDAGGAGGTFGDTGTGTNLVTFGGNRSVVSRFQANATDTLAKITARFSGLAGGTGSQHVRGVVYADSAGAPGALVGTSTTFVTVNSGDALAAHDFTMSGEAVTNGSYYWLGIWIGLPPVANIIQLSYDGSVGAGRYNTGNTYADSGAAANPFGAATTGDFSLDVYATLTGGGGGGAWQNLASATQKSYTLAAGDLAHNVRCNVTATNAAGTSSAVSSNALLVTAAVTSGTKRQRLLLLGVGGGRTHKEPVTQPPPTGVNGIVGLGGIFWGQSWPNQTNTDKYAIFGVSGGNEVAASGAPGIRLGYLPLALSTSGYPGVQYSEAHGTDMLLYTAGHAEIVCSGYGQLLPNPGNAGYQAAFRTDAEAYVAAKGLSGVWLDNFVSDAAQMGPSVGYPYYNKAGAVVIATVADWQAAVVSFAQNAIKPMVNAGRYMLVNGGGFDDTGAATKTWAARYAQYVSSICMEYLFCNPSYPNAAPVPTRAMGTAYYQHWDTWLDALEYLGYTLGVDVLGGVDVAVPVTDLQTARFTRASFIMGWNPAQKWSAWAWAANSNVVSAINFWTSVSAIDTGFPTGARQAVGACWKRQCEHKLVYVNPTQSAQLADGLTVPALDALFV